VKEWRMNFMAEVSNSWEIIFVHAIEEHHIHYYNDHEAGRWHD
jgi:hypothetical protein